MNTRELFDIVRNQKGSPFSLRTRMTLLVTAEILVCALVTYGVDLLFHYVVKVDIPLVVELLCACLMVGVLVTSHLVKLFFNPIKKLRKAMEQVADGDYSVRLHEKSRSKEIMEIYTGFNLMTHELSATEILQTDFVSNVSHEFKTPINAIEGYSTLLQGCENLDDNQREYVDKILFNTRRLSTLVGSILLLSRLENQQIPTNRTKYRLDEQIRQAVVALEPEWERKQIEFDVELDVVNYLGNEQMMHHVWSNLISNAIKFSPESGVVRVRLSHNQNGIVFAVEDQGPGLSEESQKHVFDKFYQADNSHKQEGNGLGLALVKRILVMEKGEIAVENCDGGGCRFTVVLQNK